MDYACSVWSNTKKGNIDKLQGAQNYAARIISGNFDYINTRSIDLLRSLRWATVQERCDYFTAVLMYKSVHGLAPVYLTDNVVMAGEIHDRDTRLSHSNDVHIPPYNTDVLKRSFIFNGGVIWNKLPDEIRMANDVLDFKGRNWHLCIPDGLSVVQCSHGHVIGVAFLDAISVAWSVRAGQLAAGGVTSVWRSWVRSPPGLR